MKTFPCIPLSAGARVTHRAGYVEIQTPYLRQFNDCEFHFQQR
jgi:hypothetical protein